jgi:hypothetical protein
MVSERMLLLSRNDLTKGAYLGSSKQKTRLALIVTQTRQSLRNSSRKKKLGRYEKRTSYSARLYTTSELGCQELLSQNNKSCMVALTAGQKGKTP